MTALRARGLGFNPSVGALLSAHIEFEYSGIYYSMPVCGTGTLYYWNNVAKHWYPSDNHISDIPFAEVTGYLVPSDKWYLPPGEVK